ncbi:hypothetical protein M422DRAFT_247535 [Sphaerobolus stellatus SS14]|nr:hypothetical protein M422DRAFT_247535 [Sphaerobolus stellatus SS14]
MACVAFRTIVVSADIERDRENSKQTKIPDCVHEFNRASMACFIGWISPSPDLTCHSYSSSESRRYSGLHARQEVSTRTTEDPTLILLASTTKVKSIGNSAIQTTIMSLQHISIQSELKFPTLDTTPRISDPRFRITSTLSMTYIFGLRLPPRQPPF